MEDLSKSWDLRSSTPKVKEISPFLEALMMGQILGDLWLYKVREHDVTHC